MDTKELGKNWRSGMRRWKYLLVMITCITPLLTISFLVLIRAQKSNEARFRSENYERIKSNLVLFSDMIEDTNTLCENLNVTQYILPSFLESDYEELKNQLKEKDRGIIEDRGLFVYDSIGYKMLSRLHSMAMINQNVSELVILNMDKGVSIVAASDGRFGALCSSIEEMKRLIHIDGDLSDIRDKDLLPAMPTKYATARLYVARVINENAVLLCGFTDAAWENTILTNSCGRSYHMEQMILELPQGPLLYRSNHSLPEELGISDDVIDMAVPIVNVGEYTIMKYRQSEPDYQLIAVLSETGATDAAASDLFKGVILLTVLWLLVVTGICCYILLCILRPLKQISSQLPVEDESADSIEKIASAISVYDRQLTNNRLTIREQLSQLRRAYLKLLVMSQTPSITPVQMQELGILELLERFVMITVYPNDGHWGKNDVSAQEKSYRSHVTLTTVQELLKPHITDDRMEFLMFDECLLLVVPVTEETDEAVLRLNAERWAMDIGKHLNERFLFGVSKVRCGIENFSRAYHDAMRSAALVEERESGRSEDITLSMLLKQNMHMMDLVYMERYGDAFGCLKEMLETLSKQKSRLLRSQQLSSLLSITYCMLTETNKTNALLIEQMNLEANALTRAESEAEALEKWEAVFTRLEKHRDEQIHSQFSNEFSSIYQYLYAHYKDPEISLSLLAEQFEMSLSTLSREFQKNTGQGFLECLHRMRVDAAKYEIEHSSTPLSEIAEAVGYTNTLTMTRAFKKYMGCTPSTFRKKDIP